MYFLAIILGCAVIEGTLAGTFNTFTTNGDPCICTHRRDVVKNQVEGYQDFKNVGVEEGSGMVSSVASGSLVNRDRNGVTEEGADSNSEQGSRIQLQGNVASEICVPSLAPSNIRVGTLEGTSGSASGKIITTSGAGSGSNSFTRSEANGSRLAASGSTIKAVSSVGSSSASASGSASGSGSGSGSVSGFTSGVGFGSGLGTSGTRIVNYNRPLGPGLGLGNRQAEVVSANMGGYKTSADGWYGKHKRYRGGNDRHVYGGYPAVNRYDY